jgi:hypothetical protein
MGLQSRFDDVGHQSKTLGEMGILFPYFAKGATPANAH